jgi:hypothetical protein
MCEAESAQATSSPEMVAVDLILTRVGQMGFFG